MPSLKAILKPNQTLSIAFGEEQVNVTYDAQYLTPAFEVTLKGLSEEKKATESFLKMFITLIKKWDLKADDADPEPIPLTVEGLQDIPFDILGEILTKVQEAVVPNEKTGATSDGGLQPVDSLEPSPTGTP